MASISDAQAKIGELLIIGFEGKKLSDDTAAFLSQARIGGVIYFTHNYENPEQLAELSNAVQECRTEVPLWVAADQEGGKVQRFKDPFTIIPSAREVGATESPRLAFEIGEVMARELAAVGVNLNFAPVVDINTNPDCPIIGKLDRAYGSTEDTVSKMITGIVRGHVTNKVQACIKHFPGHGDTNEDTHLELSRINKPLEELKNREFRPFVRAFKSRCNMVMVAHILNEAIDPEFPATLSKKTLQDVLRKDLRYSRVIVSDDMVMDAIQKNFGVEDAAVRAINAGCDLLCYRNEEQGRKAYEALYKGLENGKIDPTQVVESAERLKSLKKDTLSEEFTVDPSATKEIIGCDQHKEVIEKVRNS